MPAFIPTVHVRATKPIVLPATCPFHGRPLTHALAVGCVNRRVGVRMQSENYVIQQSEYVDPEGDDDSGDGFFGEKDDMDEHLGIQLPDDLPSFDRKAINEAKTRDELVEKLTEIHQRRSTVYEDRRRGLGMDNVDNYLSNL